MLAVIFIPIFKEDDTMATAKKLPSGSWRCLVFSHYEYVTEKDGNIKKKRIYESFTCDDPSPAGKRRCEAMAAEYANKKEQSNLSSYKLTFGEAMDAYISERSQILSPASIRKYRSMQKEFSMLNNYKLKDINQKIVQQYINSISGTLSPKTVRDRHGLITAVLKRYDQNVILNTTLPKKKRVERNIPSECDIKLLIEAAKGTEMEVPIYLGAFGMMRRGEISALRKSDFENNVVHISKTMVLSPDNKWIVKAPKSYAGDRFVPVPQFVVDAFMALPKNGVNMTPNIITSRFEHVLNNAGIEHFRFHDLRHYSASIQHALGIPDAYIMQAGGWGNDRVLKDVYRHTLEDSKKKMSNIAINYFENMQHEMQHGTKKTP